MSTIQSPYPLILCVMASALILIGATAPFLTILSLGASVIVALCAAQSSIQSPGPSICKGIILLLCMQNLMIGLGAHVANNSNGSISYLTQIPFIVIAVIWLSYFITDRLSGKALSKIEKMFIALVLCVGISVIIGRGSIQSIAITIRNLIVFCMSFQIGRRNLRGKRDFSLFSSFLVKLSIILIFVGEFLLIGGYNLQKKLGIHEVYIAKGSPFPEGSLDARFYTTLIHTQYPRMGSLYFEPINLAYLFAAALVVSLFVSIYKDLFTKYICSGILLIGLLQTVGKGGYLIIGCIVCCFIFERFVQWFSAKVPSKRAKKKIIIFITAIIVCFFIFYVKYIGAAIMPHIWGITQTWSNVIKRPWGYGLGTGGNAAQILGGADSADWYSTGGETALMSFCYQIGFQGIFFFIFVLLLTSVRKSKCFTPFFYLPTILLGISLMQDNTFTPQCITVFMFLQGGAQAIESSTYDMTLENG